MEVFIANYDNGDYYCEGNHLIGIYSTEEKANEAVSVFKSSGPYRAQYRVVIYPVTIDAVIPEEW